MTGKNAPVTDTELQILDVLWSSGPLRIRDITRAMYPGGRPSEYATVQSLLERLESKGYIHRDRSSFAHIFSACVERTAFIGSQLQEMADRVCEGSLTPILLSLVEKVHLGERERRDLIRLIESAPEAASGDEDASGGRSDA